MTDSELSEKINELRKEQNEYLEKIKYIQRELFKCETQQRKRAYKKQYESLERNIVSMHEVVDENKNKCECNEVNEPVKKVTSKHLSDECVKKATVTQREEPKYGFGVPKEKIKTVTKSMKEIRTETFKPSFLGFLGIRNDHETNDSKKKNKVITHEDHNEREYCDNDNYIKDLDD